MWSQKPCQNCQTCLDIHFILNKPGSTRFAWSTILVISLSNWTQFDLKKVLICKDAGKSQCNSAYWDWGRSLSLFENMALHNTIPIVDTKILEFAWLGTGLRASFTHPSPQNQCWAFMDNFVMPKYQIISKLGGKWTPHFWITMVPSKSLVPWILILSASCQSWLVVDFAHLSAAVR